MNSISTPGAMSAKKLAQYALFTALIFLLGFTSLGYIYLPIAAITTVHIPVIVGAQFFGVGGGAVLGFFFGLTSLIQCFMTPDATAMIILGSETGFGLTNLLLILFVVFLARILVGVVTALSFRLISRFDKSNIAALGVSAFLGTLTNTVLFLGGLALLAGEQTAAAFGVAADGLFAAIMGVVTLNGLLEAAAAVLVSMAVGKALLAYSKKHVN